MSIEDDDFYKAKPLKLNKEAEKTVYSKIEDTPPEPVVQHFKPIVRESPYSMRNLLGLLIPIIVTAVLGFAVYKGVVTFRDLAANADAADREATTANNNAVKMKQTLADYESKTRDIDQMLPQLTDRIRTEAQSKAASKYHEEIEATRQKTDSAKQDHLNEEAKKLTDAERIATEKVLASKLAIEKMEKQIEAGEKEATELRTFLRANKRTMRANV